MAPAKRKASTTADAAGSSAIKKQKKVVEPTASSSRPSRTLLAEAAVPRSTRSSIGGKSASEKPANNQVKSSVKGKATKSAIKTAKKVQANGDRKRGKSVKASSNEEGTTGPGETSKISVDVPFREKTAADDGAEDEADVNGEGPAYWLMKAEPESRIEKGKDVKFSIDDLQSAQEPEGWDGM